MNIIEYENYKENKTHSDTLFPYNTYPCSIPVDFSEVPLHWHNEMEIVYVKKGSGLVELDFEKHTVKAGDMIVVLPGQMHGIYRLEDYSMEYENIIFSIDMLISKSNDTLFEEFFVPFLAGSIVFDHIITEGTPRYAELQSCLDRADALCTDWPEGYKLALKACLFEFLFLLRQSTDISVTRPAQKNMDRIKTIIKYIETNYQAPISIDEIASVCGFSSSHFMKFFKNTMGTSFIDYLNDYRLSMASRMLLSSDATILMVAADCGYDNLSYFNRLFKKKYGMTPSAYRGPK